jgi:hypothetical protein
MSAYQLGQVTGSTLLAVLGLALIFKGWQSLRLAKQAASPTPAMPAPMRSAPAQTVPSTPASQQQAAVGDFFSATPINPAAPDPSWHVDYTNPTTPRTEALRPSARIGSVVVLVIGGFLAVAGTFGSYQTISNSGGSVTLPDQLLGMERIAADSPISAQLDLVKQAFPAALDVEPQLAGYASGDRLLIVLGGASKDLGGNPGDSANSDQYFSGFEEGAGSAGASFSLKTVDPGANGGQMRCADIRNGAASVCAWFSPRTYGVIVATGMGSVDYVDAAHQIRLAVED